MKLAVLVYFIASGHWHDNVWVEHRLYAAGTFEKVHKCRKHIKFYLGKHPGVTFRCIPAFN